MMMIVAQVVRSDSLVVGRLYHLQQRGHRELLGAGLRLPNGHPPPADAGRRAAQRGERGRGSRDPLQDTPCAAKHALKAFTDALRVELGRGGCANLGDAVKSGSIDTPFFEKAKTCLGVEPQPEPPVYAPEIVAEAIVECVQRPVRDVIVGGMG